MASTDPEAMNPEQISANDKFHDECLAKLLSAIYNEFQGDDEEGGRTHPMLYSIRKYTLHTVEQMWTMYQDVMKSELERMDPHTAATIREFKTSTRMIQLIARNSVKYPSVLFCRRNAGGDVPTRYYEVHLTDVKRQLRAQNLYFTDQLLIGRY
jgi:hypothetical protein